MCSDVADGNIREAAVVEHQGQFWLVPEWLAEADLGLMRPVRIVSIAQFRHEDLRRQQGCEADFCISEAIPMAMLQGRVPGRSPGTVIEKPPIEVRARGIDER